MGSIFFFYPELIAHLLLWVPRVVEKSFSVCFLHPIHKLIMLHHSLHCFLPPPIFFLNSQTLYPLLIGNVLQPLNHPNYSSELCNTLIYDNQNCIRYSKWGCTINLYMGITVLWFIFSSFLNYPLLGIYFFFTAATHWLDVFIKVPTATLWYFSSSVSTSSYPIPMCITLDFTELTMLLPSHPVWRKPLGTFHNHNNSVLYTNLTVMLFSTIPIIWTTHPNTSPFGTPLLTFFSCKRCLFLSASDCLTNF